MSLRGVIGVPRHDARILHASRRGSVPVASPFQRARHGATKAVERAIDGISLTAVGRRDHDRREVTQAGRDTTRLVDASAWPVLVRERDVQAKQPAREPSHLEIRTVADVLHELGLAGNAVELEQKSHGFVMRTGTPPRCTGVDTQRRTEILCSVHRLSRWRSRLAFACASDWINDGFHPGPWVRVTRRR